MANINNKSVDETDEMKQNMVVRMEGDSDNNLQALFECVLKPTGSNRPLQIPYRMRDLPQSFFNPPANGSKSSSVCHSRENSADSAFSSGSNVLNASKSMQPQFKISHSRAHSSPAVVQQTQYGGINQSNTSSNNKTNNNNINTNANSSGALHAQAQQVNRVQHAHMKQRSYDVVSTSQLHRDLGDLPPGWEQAKTEFGQIYYIKYVNYLISIYAFIFSF